MHHTDVPHPYNYKRTKPYNVLFFISCLIWSRTLNVISATFSIHYTVLGTIPIQKHSLK